MSEAHPTDYWHRLDDGRIQCDVCPRACKMHDGQRGLCFVRGVEAGEVKLYTYGRSSGFCVDPVEKKPPIWRSEERRVGIECRSRWSPYH